MSFPVGPIYPAGPDGRFVAGGPVGPFGTMSPSDSDPAGPAGPYVAGSPVGPDMTLSPFISDHACPAGRYVAVGPVGPFVKLSPSDCHPAGSAGPYVAGGPVVPDGKLSPFTSDHAGPAGRHVAVGPVGPFGTLSPSDCYPAGPAGPYVAGGPVGPDGTLSPLTSNHAGPAGRHVAVIPVGPSGTLSPSTSGSVILVDPGGSTLLPGEGGPKFVLGAAVPLPAVRDPRVASSPGEVLVGDCDVITDENITRHDGWSDPEVVGSSSVVARVGSTALPRRTDTTLVCVDECTECDILDQFETINGMPVYYGGDLYDSEDSDWDDPYDIASAAYVEDYNFDVPEGMELMVYQRRRD